MKLGIAGLAVRTQRGCHPIAPLEGPLLAAAIGARVHGAETELIGVIPDTLRDAEERMISLLAGGGQLLSRSSSPALVWKIDDTCGKASLIGDPTCWATDRNVLHAAVEGMVLANGDPRWLAEIINAHKPQSVSFDVHGEWVAYREADINFCLRNADLITVTEADLVKLPSCIWAGVRSGAKGGPALVVKRGAGGVSLFCDDEELVLPPPEVTIVKNDVGAGDFLLGSLSAYFTQNDPNGVNEWAVAYESVRGPLAQYLKSASLEDYLDNCLFWAR